MATQTYGSTSTATAVAPRVNLLPPEIAEQAALRKSQVAMVATGLAAVAVVGVLYLQATAKVSAAEEDKAQAAAANAKLRTELQALDHVKSTYARVDAANKTVATAMAFEVRWSTYLHDLTLTIPENVWLDEVAAEMTVMKQAAAGNTEQVLDGGLGTVTFKGSAFSQDDVASWLESLAKQKGYADPYFTKAEDRMATRVVIDFESTTYLSEKALSNRYAKGLPR
ncbi:MAG TPA: PilN domain-containing protein [Frankiaceae bacterium]|nr:PilN domain-containing protein [Frankiaceae bacterium]